MKKHAVLTKPQIAVIVFTLIAAILRIYLIDSLPPSAWWDEVWFALRAREIIQTGQFPVYFPTDFGGASAGPAYLAAFAQLLGFDTPWGGRITSALFGTLSIPLAYACLLELLAGGKVAEHGSSPPTLSGTPRLRFLPPFGEEVHNGKAVAASQSARALYVSQGRVGAYFTPIQQQWIAALTAIGLGYTLFYVTMGRVAMEIGYAPVTALFVIWQMARGIYRQKWTGWVLAGVVGGISQYNGLQVRFVLPLMLFFFILAFINTAPSNRIQMIKGGLMLAIPGILVCLPLIRFFYNNPEWFTARAAIVSDVGPGMRFETIQDMYRYNFRMITRVFFIEGSYDPKNGVPGVPLLDPIQAAGFIVGLGWCIYRIPRSTLARLLLIWLVWMCVPSLITEGAPNLGRMIGVAPPTAALIAIGWVTIHSFFRTKAISNSPGLDKSRQASPPPSGRRVVEDRVGAAVFLSTLVLLSGLYHTWRLFRSWPSVSNLREQFTADSVDTAELLLSRTQTQAVFSGDIPEETETPIIAFDFLFPGTEVRQLDLRKCLPVPHQRAVPTTYLLITDRNQITLPLLQDMYPNLEIQQSEIDLWDSTGTLLEIPAHASAPAPAVELDAEFGSGITLRGYEWSGPQVRAGESLFVTTYWHMLGDTDKDLTAFAHLGTGLTEDEPIIAQNDSAPCVGFYPTWRWLPGDQVPHGFALVIPEEAPPGTYPLSVGWYEWPSLTPLPLLSADEELPGERVVIGQVEVVE